MGRSGQRILPLAVIVVFDREFPAKSDQAKNEQPVLRAVANLMPDVSTARFCWDDGDEVVRSALLKSSPEGATLIIPVPSGDRGDAVEQLCESAECRHRRFNVC